MNRLRTRQARPARRGGGLGATDDASLAKRAAARDPAAFEEIFARYHQPIYRYCLSILRDAGDAEDALQATMSSALGSLPGDRREIALRPWLYRVAHNHAISIARGRGRRAEPASDTLDLVADPGAERAAADRSRLRELLADLDQLPERQRAALTLRELSGLSHDEVGAALEISPGAARQAVYEARVSLSSFAAGREMECERVRHVISDGDGRSMRALTVAAHLRACRGCSDFRDGIGARGEQFAALFPPLPAAAAAAVLKAVAGGAAVGSLSAAGAGGVAVAGKGIGASLALKSAAIVCVGAIGVGADRAGVIDLPGIGAGESQRSAEQAEPAPPAAAEPAAAEAVADPGTVGESAASAPDRGGPNEGGESRNDHGSDNGDRAAHGGNGGARGAPAHANAGGAGGETPAASGVSNAGGKTPAHAQGTGAPAHSNAGGDPAPTPAPAPSSVTGPPPLSNAGGSPQSAAASGTPPGQASAPASSAAPPASPTAAERSPAH